MTAPLSAEQVQRFRRDGYLMLEGHFDAGGMERLLRVARADPELAGVATAHEERLGAVRGA